MSIFRHLLFVFLYEKWPVSQRIHRQRESCPSQVRTVPPRKLISETRAHPQQEEQIDGSKGGGSSRLTPWPAALPPEPMDKGTVRKECKLLRKYKMCINDPGQLSGAI